MGVQYGRRFGLLAAGLVLAMEAAACGEMTVGDESTPYWTIRGEVTVAEDGTFIGDDVRVALLWPATDEQPFRVAQDLAITSAFPATFEIALTDPPTSSLEEVTAQTPGGEPITARGAAGQIIVYEDLNGNGRFDVFDPSAGAFVDHVVGLADMHMLAYLEAESPIVLPENAAMEPNVLQPGITVWEIALRSGEQPVIRQLSPEERIRIILENNPALDRIACPDNTFILTMTRMMELFGESWAEAEETEGLPLPETPPVVPDLPSYAQLSCSPDGMSFSYGWLDVDDNGQVCGPAFYRHELGVVRWDEALYGPRPANWPCD